MWGRIRMGSWLSLLILGVAALTGCGTMRGHAPIWVDLDAGEPVPYAEMIADLAEVRVVYLGEIHTLQRHGEGELRILRSLIEKGRPVALALEQMEAFNQGELDRYARGEIDFEELAKSTQWAKRWSNYERYRPLLEAARQAGAPIVALNARSEIIRETGRKGLAGLSPEERRELPEQIELNDPRYEKLLNMRLMVHAGVDAQRLHKVYEAQVARDEQMASALAKFLGSERGKGRQAIVVCGAGHVSYGLGTPARVRRRMPGITDRIVIFSESNELTLSPEEQAMARQISVKHQDLRAIDRPIADYAQVAPLREE